MLDVQDDASRRFQGEWDSSSWVPKAAENAISLQRLDHLETLIVRKSRIGCSGADVGALGRILREAATGRHGPIKFLVLDFANDGESSSRPMRSEASQEDLGELVVATANLILKAPIVSVAWARGWIAGGDLQLALACSMIAGEEDSRFCFDDPMLSPELYTLLARKIGFVRAERLIEQGDVLDAGAMRDLLLLKEVAAGGSGTTALEAFLRRRLRRHNSSCGIYKAQRIALPLESPAKSVGLPALAA